MVIKRRVRAVKSIWSKGFNNLSNKTKADLRRQLKRISTKTESFASYKSNPKWNKAEYETRRLTDQVTERRAAIEKLKYDKENALRRHRDELLYSPTIKEMKVFRSTKRNIKDGYNKKIKTIREKLIQDEKRLKKNKKIMQNIETMINVNLMFKEWGPMLIKTTPKIAKDTLLYIGKSSGRTVRTLIKPPKKQSFGYKIPRLVGRELVEAGKAQIRTAKKYADKPISKSIKQMGRKNIIKGYADIATQKVKKVGATTVKVLKYPIRKPLARIQLPRVNRELSQLRGELIQENKVLERKIAKFNKLYDRETFFDAKRIKKLNRDQVKAEGLARKKALDSLREYERTLLEKQKVVDRLMKKRDSFRDLLR